VCGECGARLSLGPALQERKFVTILYADLVGSTAVGERFDVETHQSLMNAYFEAMTREAESTGGTVEQFVGDAVLAVFGIPVAHEDDADRALGAAGRMLGHLDALNAGLFARHGLRLEVRIGINTGEVVTGGATVDLGALAGDALNVAARLAGHAPEGGILVSEATVRASRTWRFRSVGGVELRGRSAPVHAFEVAGPQTAADAPAAVGRAPMAGRDRELALLASRQAQVESDRRPHLVTVFGVGGIGKSRLAAEFSAAARRADPPARILFGRCRPYGEDAVFGALAEILASLAGIDDADPAEVAAGRIGDLVERLAARGDPPPEGTTEAFAYVVGLSRGPSPFAGVPARQVRSAIRGAWAWLLTALSTESTLVVTVEDLHWADPALLDLLEHLCEAVAGPVLFICPARPVLLDRRSGWGKGISAFSSILLDPLTVDQGRALVGWYLGGGPAGLLVERIVDRAEGNPFFIEEVIRSLIDEGAIKRSDSGWEVSGGLDEIEIPRTVRAVIAARIDLLESSHKRVLQCAAVIGRTFWPGAVAHLLGGEAGEIQEVLDALEGRELILAGAESAVTGEREYRFKHTMVRQVAYDGLARRDRSRLHRAVADWVRAGGEGERREMIGVEAHHLALAYDGVRGGADGDGDVEGLRTRALVALLAAAGFARQRVALGQSRYFAREARRLADSPIEASLAAEALGEAYFYGYEGDPAWRALREAVELRLGEGDGPDPDVARLCARALQLPIRWQGAMESRPDEVTALRYLHLGMDHAPPESEEAVRLLTLKGFWQHAFPAGESLISPEESLRSAEQAVAVAARMGRPDLESAALDALTAYYIPRGLYSAARAPTQRRLSLIGDLHDLWEIGDTYAMQGWVGYHVGDYPEALRRSEEGFARTVSEAPSLALHCLRWRIESRFRTGDWDGVRRDLAIARELLGDYRDDPPDYVSPMFAAAALVHELRGEHVAADAVLDVLSAQHEQRNAQDRDALPLSRFAEFVAPILARRGRAGEARRLIDVTRYRRGTRLGVLLEAALDVAAVSEDWERAETLADEARSVAFEGGLWALPAAADEFEGRAAWAAGDYATAIDLLGRASSAFGRIGARWDAARTGLAEAMALDEAGFEARAAVALRRCLPDLEEIGARAELDAARELAAVLG
jgi:class 3 adenylate cyclase